MKNFYALLFISLLIVTGTGCGDEDYNRHGEHMKGDFGVHGDTQDLMDIHGMENHMHNLHLRSGQMMDRWQRHLGSTAGRDTLYGHSMMEMSRLMHGLSEDMHVIMNEMNTMMNNEELMRDEAYKNHLRQIQRHMNRMMAEYENILDRMQEMNGNQE